MRGSVDGEEPAAGARRAARVRALRAAQRQDAALRRVGVAAGAAAQVDAAHLLQRAGRDLPGVDGRDRAGARGAPAHRPPHRPAVRDPQRPDLAALHRGDALLRRAGVAGLSGASVAAGCRACPGAVARGDRAGSSTSTPRAASCSRFWRRGPSSTTTTARRSSICRCRWSSTPPTACWRAAARVSERLPWFNGSKLDDIVDYLTYVFVPALIVWRAPARARSVDHRRCRRRCCSRAATASAAPTPRRRDHFFTGFPSYWNIVVALSLRCWICRRGLNAAILLGLAVLVFVPIRYVYPSRTPIWPVPTNLLGAVWGAHGIW